MENNKIKIMIFKILPKGFISRVFGYTSLIPVPQGLLKRIIAWYSLKYGVNLGEAEIPAEGFKNLNKFLTQIIKGVRSTQRIKVFIYTQFTIL